MKKPLPEKPVSVSSAVQQEIHVLIFKTNIQLKKDIKNIGTYFDTLAGVIRWNVDIEDRDKVLRVESINENHYQIINMVNQAGFYCEELPD